MVHSTADTGPQTAKLDLILDQAGRQFFRLRRRHLPLVFELGIGGVIVHLVLHVKLMSHSLNEDDAPHHS